VGAVVRVVGDVVRLGTEARRRGERGLVQVGDRLRLEFVEEGDLGAKGASVSARTFGITGRRTIADGGFAERASATKDRAFSAVWAAFV
jgi:hypothetical protein